MVAPAGNAGQSHELPKTRSYTFILENRYTRLALAALFVGTVAFNVAFIRALLLKAPLTPPQIIILAVIALIVFEVLTRAISSKR